MPTMPPPEARDVLGSVFTHEETIGDHPLTWVTYTSAEHVEVYTPDGESERWIANVIRLNSRRWDPIVRANYRQASWLGRDDTDPVGREHRQTIAQIAKRLWKTANHMRRTDP